MFAALLMLKNIIYLTLIHPLFTRTYTNIHLFTKLEPPEVNSEAKRCTVVLLYGAVLAEK